MKNRYFTITIAPEKKRVSRKIKVSSSVLKWGAISSVVLFLVLSYVVTDYFSILSRVSNTDEILLENTRLLSEIERIQAKLVSMNDSLDRINLYTKKLKSITNYQGEVAQPDEFLKLGVGPLSAEEVAFKENEEILKPLMLPREKEIEDSSLLINSVNKQMEALHFKANFQEKSLSDLKVFFDDQESILRSTPSIRPTKGWLSSKFGLRRSTITGDVHPHKGIDIATNFGTDVRAPADGIVIEAGYRPDYGKVVVLSHGYHLTTLYGHNSLITVKEGQKVKRGDKIAKVGNTGRATGAHLHYEVRLKGKPVNPVNYLLN